MKVFSSKSYKSSESKVWFVIFKKLQLPKVNEVKFKKEKENKNHFIVVFIYRFSRTQNYVLFSYICMKSFIRE